jgi:RES domain-containing protein
VIVAWRICQRTHARRPLDGEGPFRFGGRWNSPGTRVVYLSSSRALAALDILVHVEDGHDLLAARYVAIPVSFSERLVERPSRLPAHWSDDPPPRTAARLGDGWAIERRSALLGVPSAVVPGEDNYLLNPLHPDAARVSVGRAVSFAFDPRLA